MIDLSYYEEQQDVEEEMNVHAKREKLSSRQYDKDVDTRRQERLNARGRGWNESE